MIRRYQHSPDQAYFERQQGRAERRTRSYTRVIDEGLTDEGLATGAIQFGLEAAATDWYLGATTQAARAHLTLAAAAADAAYRRTPRPWNPFTLEWALVASVLDGRWEQAGAIAALAEAPGAVTPHTDANSWREPFLPMLAALVLGDDARAQAHVEALRAELAAHRVPVDGETEMRELTGMADAMLRADAAALDAGLRERSARRARMADRSVENRRGWSFLLDWLGATVLLVARRRGLPVSAQVPDVPIELVG